MNLLDDYALKSPLREKNNWLKIIIMIFGIIVGVSSTSPITPFFIALCMSIVTIHFNKIPLIFYFKLMAAPLGFVLISAVIIAIITNTGNILYQFSIFGYILSIHAGGVNLAIQLFARTLSGMSCLFFLTLTTPMIELFSVLKKAYLPDAFVEIAMMMYRYIFVFLEVAMGIKYAQTVRLGYKDFKTSFKSLSLLTSSLFIRTWEQGEKLFISMNSRCYDGKTIFLDENYPIKMSELILTSLYFIFALAIFYLTKNKFLVG